VSEVSIIYVCTTFVDGALLCNFFQVKPTEKFVSMSSYAAHHATSQMRALLRTTQLSRFPNKTNRSTFSNH